MEYISDKQYQAALKRQEKKNLREKGKSLTATSMSNHMAGWIIEIQDTMLVMKKGWRDFIKTM
jgi:hypothetical protein